MGLAVGRVAERIQGERQAALFQGVKLLRDEGFRQPRITLEDHCDDAGRERTIHPVLVSD